MNRRNVLTGLVGATALTLLGPLASRSAGAHQVSIVDFEFDPPILAIRPGDTVTWTNRDFAPHTATANDDSWDTGNLDQNQHATVTFARAGRYPYICAHHPAMQAVIIVKEI